MKSLDYYPSYGEKSKIQWIEGTAVRILSAPRKEWSKEQIEENKVYYTGNLFIDPKSQAVYKLDGTYLKITLSEYIVMMKLICNCNIWLCRPVLIRTMDLKNNHNVQDNSLSKLIQRIREKLDAVNKKYYIQTSSGRGYKWRMTVKVCYIDR